MGGAPSLFSGRGEGFRTPFFGKKCAGRWIDKNNGLKLPGEGVTPSDPEADCQRGALRSLVFSEKFFATSFVLLSIATIYVGA